MSAQALRSAIDAGDVDGLRQMLEADPALAEAAITWDGNSSDPLHYLSDAPFHGFARHDRLGELTRVLIDAGAPVDGPPNAGETPLIAAASLGQAEIARVLVAAGADLEREGEAVAGGTALSHAVEFGMTEVVDVLVEAGAAVRSLKDAAGVGDIGGFLDGDVSEAERAGALRAAAACERLDVIDRLLDSGLPVDVEADGHTALHSAAWEGKAAAVRRLIERGADVNRRDANHEGTPLGWCRFRHRQLGRSPGHDEVERILLEHGAE